MKATIYKNEADSFGQYELTRTKLDNLVSFLTNEISKASGDTWINLLNSEHDQLIGSVVEVEQNKDTAFIRFALLDGNRNDENCYIIKKIKLLQLIEDWKKLVSNQAHTIVIEETNEEVKIY